jgi:hypothetical protein
MTEVQEAVFGRINELLREHFEGSLICVVDEGDEGTLSTLRYNGGLLQAIGLARTAEATLLEHQTSSLILRSQEKQEEEEE